MLLQAFEVRALIQSPKLKEQNGVLLHSVTDERQARDLFQAAVGEMLGGTSSKYDVTRWTAVVLTGPNGAFDKAERIATQANAGAGPGVNG